MEEVAVEVNPVETYFLQYPVRKLHLGCGPHILEGWLNTDVWESAPGVVLMDASQPFPFQAECFDYVFSEHQIEHLPFTSGLKMLENCFRALKPNGKIRIACPDLASVAKIYVAKDRTEEQTRFLDNITRLFMPEFYDLTSDTAMPHLIRDAQASFVMNAYFHLWGHQFMYDEDVLSLALRKVGFTDITRYAPGYSTDPHLHEIENRHRIDTYDVETFVLEATRPLIPLKTYQKEPKTWEDVFGWFDFEDIYEEAVRRAPEHAVFVEVGCLHGRSTAFMAQTIEKSRKPITFYAVDTWPKELGGFDNFWSNMSACKLTDYVKPVMHSSVEASRLFADESLDFVFIDADHSTDAVFADMTAWLPKVKPGGFLAGHDYYFDSVQKAVHEFFKEPDRFQIRKSSWFYQKS